MNHSIGYRPVRFHRVLVIIPAYNEAHSIGEVISQVRTSAPEADIVVVDDGSTDATAAIAQEVGAFVVSLPNNLGIGGAMQTGYIFAAEMGYSETIATLQALGIQACSEAEAAEARHRIRTTNLDKMAEIEAHAVQYLSAQNSHLNFQISQLRNSWSWKITAPLRKVGGVLIRLKEWSNALYNLR